MLREQRIMERIKNEMGEELNEYIATFNGCDFWKIKEGEIIVNKTFKRLFKLILLFSFDEKYARIDLSVSSKGFF